jgi:hypothetical protein
MAWSDGGRAEVAEDQGVDMWMEVEVFAEGVQGQDNAGDTLRAVQHDAQVFGQAFLREPAEVFEQERWRLGF